MYPCMIGIQSVTPIFEHCVLRGEAMLQKLSMVTAMEHYGIKEGTQSNPMKLRRIKAWGRLYVRARK